MDRSCCSTRLLPRLKAAPLSVSCTLQDSRCSLQGSQLGKTLQYKLSRQSRVNPITLKEEISDKIGNKIFPTLLSGCRIFGFKMYDLLK